MGKLVMHPKKVVPVSTVIDEDPEMDGQPKQAADSKPPEVVFSKAKIKNKVLRLGKKKP